MESEANCPEIQGRKTGYCCTNQRWHCCSLRVINQNERKVSEFDRETAGEV